MFRLLSGGEKPFPQKDLRELKRAVVRLEYDISEAWDQVSDDAKGMVKRLLTSRDERLSAKETEDEPWMQQTEEHSTLQTFVRSNLVSSVGGTAIALVSFESFSIKKSLNSDSCFAVSSPNFGSSFPSWMLLDNTGARSSSTTNPHSRSLPGSCYAQGRRTIRLVYGGRITQFTLDTSSSLCR